MGFHGIERYFTRVNGISRGRTGENVISQEGNDISREGKVLYGREQEFTGENGILRERPGFHGRERNFTGALTKKVALLF